MFTTFSQFAATLRGHDNLNVVPMEGGYTDRLHFMQALVKKAGIHNEVPLSQPDQAQLMCRLDKQGNIYIEVLGDVKSEGDMDTGSYTTWTINSSWNVQRGTKPYRVKQHLVDDANSTQKGEIR